MNISYNWLKEYVDFDLTPDEVAAALTSIGLETGSVEEVQTIKGGLEGLVIGEVLTCEAHPNSDHMHITTVNLGQGEPVQIVCGAPNVAAGQKVVVATLGAKLYDGDECFTIKKSKLRGVESNGMICADNDVSDDFYKTPESRWLCANAADFGFILRYPRLKEQMTGIDFEPWHYRYVGVEAARIIAAGGLCLEEFLHFYSEKYI